MAGVPGMRDRISTSPAYAEAVRARIRCGQIVKALQEHVLGEREMTNTQVQAAMILLRKVVPDKTVTDLTIRRVEQIPEDQSLRMAEAAIESARARTELGRKLPDLVHNSVPA